MTFITLKYIVYTSKGTRRHSHLLSHICLTRRDAVVYTSSWHVSHAQLVASPSMQTITAVCLTKVILFLCAPIRSYPNLDSREFTAPVWSVATCVTMPSPKTMRTDPTRTQIQPDAQKIVKHEAYAGTRLIVNQRQSPRKITAPRRKDQPVENLSIINPEERLHHNVGIWNRLRWRVNYVPFESNDLRFRSGYSAAIWIGFRADYKMNCHSKILIEVERYGFEIHIAPIAEQHTASAASCQYCCGAGVRKAKSTRTKIP